MTARTLVLILCAGSIGWAATDTGVRGPVAGYIFDSQSLAVRPMIGIPGASYLGTPAITAVQLASVAPNGSSVLAVRAGKLVLYRNPASGTPAAIPMPGAISGVDRFAWSADSSSVAVFSSKSGQAQLIGNLAGTPSIGAKVDLSTASGQVTAMACDGQRLILGLTAASGGIYTATATEGLQKIASAAAPSAIGLAGADLYFADQQSQQVWQVKTYAQQPAAVLFASDDSISKPVGVQLSADGNRLYVANAGSLKVGVYDVSSRSLAQTLALHTTPTQLDHFGDSSVFVLNSAAQGQEPIYVLSDSAAKQAVYFVPRPGASGPQRTVRYKPQ